MAGISITGVGSGIDINSLVDQLVAAERDPKVQRLNVRETKYQTQLSGFGLIKSALSELRSVLDRLGEPSLFQGRTATSANKDVFTATAGAGTAAGTYDVEVAQLATAHKLRSTGFSSADATVGTGTLTFSSGTESFSIDVADGSDSLGAIRDAINNDTGNAFLNAGIVNVDDGLGGTESRLVLTARNPGSDNELTVTASDDDGNHTDAAGLSRLVYDPAGSAATNLVEVNPAVDAQVRVDGQLATRSSNTVDDLIDGVTLNLVEADPGNSYSLTIAENSNAAKAAVKAFVEAFNGYIDTQENLTGYDPEAQQGGPLVGDFTLRGLEARLRQAMSSRVAEAGDVDSLAVLGITTGRDGRLSVDETALDAALGENPTAVAALFGGEAGVVARTDSLVSGFLETNGLLDSRIDALNNRIEDIGDNRLALARRIDKLESRLLAQFTAMDRLVSQLQNTGNFLSQQLANLPLPGSNNR